MKKFSVILVVIICLLSTITGCAQKASANIRVVLDWTPNTNHTGLYVALQKGYYSAEGLTVELMQPPEDGAVPLVAAGGAQFGVDFQESLGPAIAQKLPVTAVAAIISHNTSGVVSLAESGINSPKDLAGKRFASWGTPLVTEMMRAVVTGDGGSFDEVTLVPNTVTDVVSALQADIDAVWVYEAWDGIALQLAGLDTNYFAFADCDPTFDYYTPVLVVNNDFAAQNPEAVKKFMAATVKGYTFAMENPGEAADILLKQAPELDFALVHASQEYLADRYQADSPRWGEIDPGRWNAFYAWMYEKGLLERDILGEGFTNEYL